VLASGIVPSTVSAIPAFARRHAMSCRACHQPFPALSAFGETYAGNGFRLRPDEPPRDTLDTGDEDLWLPRQLPLAIRFDAFFQTFTNGNTATDFETPYLLKILSGAPISRKLSYYLYFYLFERGEVEGVEDAYVQLNDVAGEPVDIIAGQFQVSDPMFKRELRLEFQDYAVYRTRIGDQPADLTYDRGVVVTADLAGFAVNGIIVNGNGLGEAEEDRHFDNDPAKNFMLHASREIGHGLRLGAMGYSGRQEDGGITNTLWMVGVDGTVSYGPFELNLQYLHREDDQPTFTPGEPQVKTDGGFAELIYRPNDRWYGVALYNRVSATSPVLNPGLGGPADVSRYETMTVGAGYMVRRNFRVMSELTFDTEQETGQLTVGISTAF
jgi:hypothetical protein